MMEMCMAEIQLNFFGFNKMHCLSKIINFNFTFANSVYPTNEDS